MPDYIIVDMDDIAEKTPLGYARILQSVDHLRVRELEGKNPKLQGLEKLIERELKGEKK